MENLVMVPRFGIAKLEPVKYEFRDGKIWSSVGSSLGYADRDLTSKEAAYYLGLMGQSVRHDVTPSEQSE